MRDALQGIFAAFLLVLFLWAFLNSDGVFSNMRILMQ